MKPEAPSFRPFALLAFTALLSSCASDSGFARIRNPLAEEAAALSSWVEQKKAGVPPQQAEDITYENPAADPTPAPTQTPYRYFGR